MLHLFISYVKTSNCCKMAPDKDTEWPNISKCSFFQALTLCQISCFPPKTQDWLDIGSYAPALSMIPWQRSWSRQPVPPFSCSNFPMRHWLFQETSHLSRLQFGCQTKTMHRVRKCGHILVPDFCYQLQEVKPIWLRHFKYVTQTRLPKKRKKKTTYNCLRIELCDQIKSKSNHFIYSRWKEGQ